MVSPDTGGNGTVLPQRSELARCYSNALHAAAARSSGALRRKCLDALLKRGHGLIHLFLGDYERRHKAHHLRSRRYKEETACRSGAAHLRRGGRQALGEHDPENEAPATHLRHCVGGVAGHALEPRSELCSPGLYIVEDVCAVDLCQHRIASCCGEKVAAVRGRVLTGDEDVGLVAAEHGADGHAATEGLGAAEHVGLHAELLVCPEGACAANTHLNLVKHEQRATLVAQVARGLEEGPVAGSDAALALQRLEQDGGEAFAHALLGRLERLAEGVDIVVGRVHKAVRHG
mmetsp:Transcript_4167/g.11799  ORF Transcript_4167/g.11799 Transcript_4167/m.11799 type:complete len:289 (+) Transcript_4167:919-1785(+)